MSDVVTEAVAALTAKLDGAGFDGSAKFVIEGEGSIILDTAGVRVGDEGADCILSADAKTFQSILAGDASATAAFMEGRLRIDGDMGVAMRLGKFLG